MTHAENKRGKAKKIGAVALSLVLFGGGVGAYYGLGKPDSKPPQADLDNVKEIDDKDKTYHIDDIEVKLDEDGNYVFEKKDKKSKFDHLEQVALKEVEEGLGGEGKDFSHLEQVVLAEVEENIQDNKDFSHLEQLALAEVKEREEATLVRNKDGSIAFDLELDKEDSDLSTALAGINNPEQPSKPTEPSVPVEPEQPSKPTEPSVPVEPEQPSKPTEPSVPVEPEQPSKPTEPEEPVITTDVIYKTDYLGFDVEKVNDDTLEKGKEVVVQEGVAGSRVTKYKVTFKDGKEVKREVLEVTEELPINKVVHVGTKDSDPLRNLVSYANGLVESDYSEDSWASFIVNLEKAENVLANERSSQAEVDNALDDLQASIDKLVLVEIEEDDDEEQDDSDDNKDEEYEDDEEQQDDSDDDKDEEYEDDDDNQEEYVDGSE